MAVLSLPSKLSKPLRLGLFLLTLALIALAAALGPAEKTLGTNVRLIYLHGAWVWAALVLFAAAGLVGAAALLARKRSLHAWSQALGYTALLFWLTYLPQSLMVMQINWGGLFLDEPRWRVPMSFAVVAVLLQLGLYFFNQPALTSMANAVFAVVLLTTLHSTGNILHPDSPILNSDARGIQLYFAGLVALALLAAFQIALWVRRSRLVSQN